MENLPLSKDWERVAVKELLFLASMAAHGSFSSGAEDLITQLRNLADALEMDYGTPLKVVTLVTGG